MSTVIGLKSNSEQYKKIETKHEFKCSLRKSILSKEFDDIDKKYLLIGDLVGYHTTDKNLQKRNKVDVKFGEILYQGIILEINNKSSFNYLIGITNPIDSEFGETFDKMPSGVKKLLVNVDQSKISKFAWTNEKNIFLL